MSKKKQTTQQLSTKINFWVGLVILSTMVGAITSFILFKSLNDAPKAQGQTIKQEQSIVKVVEAKEHSFCADAIKCIRDVGEELGRDNETIMTMIRIARFESRFNPRAKNKSSSASGLFQIIAGTWYSNDCVGDKWNTEDNTRCAYKIQAKRGFQPWQVCTNGLAKCY